MIRGRFLARNKSESGWGCDGEETRAREDGCKKDKDGGVAECGINKSRSSCSSSRRERVAGIKLELDDGGLLEAVEDEAEAAGGFGNVRPVAEVGCGNEVEGTLPRAGLV